jgi:uncharacterized membrane protein YhaH (DUF805 family)
MKELPTLGFIDAIQLASGRILDFKGRSRRSELWWWMLFIIIIGNIITFFTTDLLVNAICSIIYMFCGLSATVRRLHDSGKSAIWVYISYALGCVIQIITATSTAMNKLMDELSYGSFNSHTMEKIVEDNGGDFVTISVLSFVAAIFAIIVIIMCLLDSTPGPNKYGESPKYVNE